MGVIKNRRPVLGWLAFAAGVFLITAGIITGFSLVGKAGLDGGRNDFRKVAASEKNPSGNPDGGSTGTNSFSQFQMDSIRTRLGNVQVAFIARMQSGTAEAEAVKSSCRAEITGVDSYYTDFHCVNMLEGSFISPYNENKDKYAAVIEDTIAWDLFKTNLVIGRTIHLSGHDFTITGVFKKDMSVIARLTDDGIPRIFVPLESLLMIDASAGATGFEAGTPGDERLDRYKQDISAALQAAGKNPQDYNLTDYNIEGAILEEKPYIAVFILGLICIVSIVFIIVKSVKTIRNEFRQSLGTDYFMDIVKGKAGIFAKELARLAAAAIFGVLIWVMTSFRVYIPPTMVPDQLIDFAYYSGLIKAAISDAMASLGYIPSVTEIGFHTTDGLLMWILCITIPAGLLLFFTGLASLRDEGQSAIKRAVAGTAALLCSVALMLPVCNLMGLVPVIGLQQLIVLGLFVFLFSARDILT